MIQSRFLGLAFGALMILGFEASASATPMAAASSVVGLSASSGHVVQVTVGMERRGARRYERQVHRYERRGERYAHRSERRAIRHGYY
jgi:hypothetical protein